VRETGVANLSLIPSDIDLVGAEVELVNMENREKRLRDALARIRDHYHYIIIGLSPFPRALDPQCPDRGG